jgi:hypothetical protein
MPTVVTSFGQIVGASKTGIVALLPMNAKMYPNSIHVAATARELAWSRLSCACTTVGQGYRDR